MTKENKQLQEGDLLHYLEGTASPRVITEIENSPELSAIVAEMATMTNFLQSHLHRQNCPSAFQLGDYYLSLLDKEESQPIDDHIGTCPHCVRELAITQQQLGQPLTKPSLAKQFKIWVAELVNQIKEHTDSPPSQQLTPVLRGKSYQTLQQFTSPNGLQLMIDVQPDPQQIGSKVMKGLVIGIENYELTIYLWRDATPIHATVLDEGGNFTIASLQAGEYELFITGEDFASHIPAVTLHA